MALFQKFAYFTGNIAYEIWEKVATFMRKLVQMHNIFSIRSTSSKFRGRFSYLLKTMKTTMA